MPAAYTESARLLNLAPDEVMLVAAHNGDLAAAQAAGLRTGFVARQPSTAPARPRTLLPPALGTSSPTSFTTLADALGC